MKKLISKIRSALRRRERKSTITISFSLGVPGIFKIELRYSTTAERTPVNDNKPPWLRAKRKTAAYEKRQLRRGRQASF